MHHPVTPGFVTYPEAPPNGTTGKVSECNTTTQYFCSGGCTCCACSSQTTYAKCDGPEDCPSGQACTWSGGPIVCGSPSVCGQTPMSVSGDCYLGLDSSCVCHSDADCPSAFPYCYRNACGSTAMCHAPPPPQDAGVTYGPCAIADAGPANYGIPCGATTCTSQSDECCIPGGGSAVCQPRSAPCSAPALESLIVQCDGPEDCPYGTSCCEYGGESFENSDRVVFCSSDCPGPDLGFGGGTACHTSADCPASLPTCTPSDAGALSFCN